MLHIIEQVLNQEQITQITNQLDKKDAQWQDGKLTAGISAIDQKNNWQLSREDPAYTDMVNICIGALQQHPVFMSAALPRVIMPPLFSCYEPGQQYGTHVDNALQTHPETKQLLRTDLSLTLFLNEPDSYEGGELIVSDEYGEHNIKLNAGDAILYPSTSLHRVNSIKSGKRLAMVTWVQSLVRSDDQRQILHDLDVSHILLRQQLHTADNAALAHNAIEKLNQSYHNLLRMWAEC